MSGATIVHADEPNPGNDPEPTSAPSAPSINIEEVIARVRKEEKDKLYGSLNKLKDENAALRKSNEGYILRIAEYQGQLDEAKKQADNSEVPTLKARITELEKELQSVKENTPDEAAIRAKIEAEFEVKLYARDKIAEHKDNILSIFHDEVKGSTKEEVDSAIATALEKSTKVKKDLGLIDDEGNPVSVGGKGKKGKKENSGNTPAPKSPPAVNPSSHEDETFDPDYIRGLDPRSPEYAEFRRKMGLK